MLKFTPLILLILFSSCTPEAISDVEQLKGEWFLVKKHFPANDSSFYENQKDSCNRYFFYEIDVDRNTGKLQYPIADTLSCGIAESKIKYIAELQKKLDIKSLSRTYFLNLKQDTLELKGITTGEENFLVR